MSTSGAEPLEESERALFFAWKRAHEVLRTRITDEVREATGLSDPDVAVLIHAAETSGPVRQSHLVALLGWDRTRLSHHLARMESRGLVRRERVAAGVEVQLTPRGRAAVDVVRPVHAAAVRRHLVEPFSPGQLAHLREALDRITAPEHHSGP